MAVWGQPRNTDSPSKVAEGDRREAETDKSSMMILMIWDVAPEQHQEDDVHKEEPCFASSKLMPSSPPHLGPEGAPRATAVSAHLRTSGCGSRHCGLCPEPHSTRR